MSPVQPAQRVSPNVLGDSPGALASARDRCNRAVPEGTASGAVLAQVGYRLASRSLFPMTRRPARGGSDEALNDWRRWWVAGTGDFP